ncbi:exonuclease phage-type/recb c-terminal domain-containing protein [Holotrichia oblita]|uniref:Exonuclease phage-type/recb c-terminal domain-containing protein n=1 Tax=Holotrichia oblita TaxID=644536 RepID=A0ACB9SGI0_HOLOL|nr:exonuclease phage-type/recb c-terminal domain-containing protein [Holotrichia oblita]
MGNIKYTGKTAYPSRRRSRRRAQLKRQIKTQAENVADTSNNTCFLSVQEPLQSTSTSIIDKDTVSVALKKTPEEIQRIEEQTRGQANNPLWYKERCHRITASNFKDICSMKKKTSCVNKVKHLLHNSFQGNNSTRYGRRNERRALHEFQEAHNLIVEPCGLFIDEEHYMLGATPDGLVGTDACVEIKCPANAADMHPKDAILQKKIKYAELRNEGDLHLKRIHSYYYQIQGQLHITNRKLCYFIIWTPLGMLIEKIYRDDDFWNTKIVTQLREFYFKCLLPEIIDPRSTRGREIRNPPR